MYHVEVKNCNSILTGNIKVEEGKLNIKYGINGTGKTTIAKAIEVANNPEKLQELKSYFAEDPAGVTMNPPFEKVLVFNEEFVDKVVFKEDEVIENSFEVFLKTPTYERAIGPAFKVVTSDYGKRFRSYRITGIAGKNWWKV